MKYFYISSSDFHSFPRLLFCTTSNILMNLVMNIHEERDKHQVRHISPSDCPTGTRSLGIIYMTTRFRDIIPCPSHFSIRLSYWNKTLVSFYDHQVSLYYSMSFTFICQTVLIELDILVSDMINRFCDINLCPSYLHT